MWGGGGGGVGATVNNTATVSLIYVFSLEKGDVRSSYLLQLDYESYDIT